VFFDAELDGSTTLSNVAMGSPLSPVTENFFMEYFEKKAIEEVTHKPVCWFRYVDDTFIIWPHGQEKLTPQQDTVHNGKRRRIPSFPGY
jgi:hypothetical protein